MNVYVKYLLYFIVLVAVSIVYDKYKQNQGLSEDQRNYELIKKYLLNDDTILGNKPILWIHTVRDVNARHWQSFLSRNTSDLNQPYIGLCIESIIKHCGDSFNVVLIDDHSFDKLIPGWNVSIADTADPVKSHLRTLAMCKLLYYFGGVVCPNSFLCLKDLKPLYDAQLKDGNGFKFDVGVGCGLFLGSRKHSPAMRDVLNYLEALNSRDFTNEQDFLASVNTFLSTKFQVIDGKLIGTKTESNKDVLIDELLESSYVDIADDAYGLLIPSRDILNRNKYKWFARQSKAQVLEGDLAVSRYFALALGSS
jgi:hypothetical protein